MVDISISSDHMWKVEQILERLHFHRNWSSPIYSLNSALQTRLVAVSCMEFLPSLNVPSSGISGPGYPDDSPSIQDISLFVPDLPDIPQLNHVPSPSK